MTPLEIANVLTEQTQLLPRVSFKEAKETGRIYRARAKDYFGLTDEQLDSLPHEVVRNPMDHSQAARLYELSAVEAIGTRPELCRDCSTNWTKPGHLFCRKCFLKRQGTKGDVSRAIIRSEHNGERFGYAPITTPINEIVKAVEAGQRVCGVCGTPENGRKLCHDHCHSTGAFRGLLCTECNARIAVDTRLGMAVEQGVKAVALLAVSDNPPAFTWETLIYLRPKTQQ